MENRVSQFISIDEKESTPANPLVSIITPVLNGIKYLEACIQSVLSQSYPYIEHVFVDGGSTDGTLDMLISYRAKYPDRIRFISEPDKRAAEAWNKGWRMAKGEILGWSGSDDVCEPDAIMTVVEFFRTNPDAYFVFGNCNYINEKGEIIGRIHTADFDLDKAINDSGHIPTPSAFYKREVIKKVGFMDTTLHTCDLDYWIRVGKVFQTHRIEEVLSNFRIHKDSTMCSKGAVYRHAREYFIVSRRYGASIFSPRSRWYIMVVIIRPLLPILVRIYYFIKYKTKI